MALLLWNTFGNVRFIRLTAWVFQIIYLSKITKPTFQRWCIETFSINVVEQKNYLNVCTFLLFFRHAFVWGKAYTVDGPLPARELRKYLTALARRQLLKFKVWPRGGHVSLNLQALRCISSLAEFIVSISTPRLLHCPSPIAMSFFNPQATKVYLIYVICYMPIYNTVTYTWESIGTSLPILRFMGKIKYLYFAKSPSKGRRGYWVSQTWVLLYYI